MRRARHLRFRKVGKSGGLYLPADTVGLVAYYTGEDTAVGQILPDMLAGNDMRMGEDAGADTNDPAYVIEDNEKVLDFDGDDFAFDVDSDTAPSDLDFGGNMCLVACVKLREGSPLTKTHTFISRSRGFPAASQQWALRIRGDTDPDRWQVLWSDGITIRTVQLIANDVPNDTWFTLIGSISNSPDDQELYKDGSSIASLSATEIPQTSETNLTVVGAGSEGGPALFPVPMDGHAAVFALYDVFKTSAQVRAIHNDIRDHFRGLGLPMA